jgi:cell volume regulation protein A
MFLIAIVTFLGFFGNIIFKKKGVPETLSLIFLGIGVQLAGIIPPSTVSVLVPILSGLTLAIMLFGVGMELDLRDLFGEGSEAVARSTLYMFLSISFIAAIFYFSGQGIYQSLILGSIIGGETTAAAIPAITKRLAKDNHKLVANLTTEAVYNSMVLVILFFVFLNGYLNATPLDLSGVKTMLVTFFSQFSIGAVMGTLGAIFWVRFLKVVKMADYLYLATFGYILGIYAMTSEVGGSGILAVLVLGVMFLNLGKFFKSFTVASKIGEYLAGFQGEISFFLKTFFFVFLGLELSLSSFFNLGSWFIAGAAMIVLVTTRALSTAIVDRKRDGYSKSVIRYMMAQGLTPAVLSTTLLTYTVAGSAQIILIATLVIVLTNIFTTLGSFRLAGINAKVHLAPKVPLPVPLTPAP